MMHAFEVALAKECDIVSDPLREVCRYATSGGAYLRAALLWDASPEGDARAIQAAIAVEFLHAATLLQDDIFDQGQMRRGRTATYLRFGKELAVLASDWLLIRALEIAADVHPLFFRAMTKAGRSMAVAEAQELAHDAPSSKEQAQRHCWEITKGKTAELFGVCLYGAALLRGHRSESGLRWQSVGTTMGLLYQCVDDCVDLFGTEASANKTLGNDLRAGHLTTPILLAISTSEQYQFRLFSDAFQSARLTPLELSSLQSCLYSLPFQARLMGFFREQLLGLRLEAEALGIPAKILLHWFAHVNGKLRVCFLQKDLWDLNIASQHPLEGVVARGPIDAAGVAIDVALKQLEAVLARHGELSDERDSLSV